jgi:undecaprenyl-diphosphatase
VNYHLFEMINGLAGRNGAVDGVMEFFATGLLYVMFAVGAVLCGQALLQRRLRASLLVGASLVLAFAAATAVSHLSHQPRPFQTHRVVQLIAHDGGVSLPSDHATAAFTVAAAVGVFLHRMWGVVLAVAAVAVGTARVWVGVHYPGDILVALVIAVVATAAVWYGDRLLASPRADVKC